MPVIGQAFSPQFLALVLQKSEAQADRNLKAAIADRQNMLGIRQLRTERDIAAGRLNATRQSNRMGIETMKEQGRLKRAADANALKEALGQAKLQLKGRAEDRLGGLAEQRGGLLAAQTEQTTRKTENMPSPEEASKQRQAELDNLVSQTAKNREAIRMGKEKWATTKQYIEEQVRNLENIRSNRDATRELRSREAAVADAMKVLRSQADIANFVLRVQQWMQSIDKYGKPLMEKAAEDPDLKATMQALIDVGVGMKRSNQRVWDALVKKIPELKALIGGGEPEPKPAPEPLVGPQPANPDQPGAALNSAAEQAGAAIPDFR